MKTVVIYFDKRTPAVSFAYTNWKNERHVYDVQPESLEFGHYTHEGIMGTASNWVLNAQVIFRNGVARPGRRTFLLAEINLGTKHE